MDLCLSSTSSVLHTRGQSVCACGRWVSPGCHFFFSLSRPQGKSYLFFTQFKAEVKGAKIEYSEAYSQASTAGLSDVPLKKSEYEVSETTGVYDTTVRDP
ncbi:hypothetical protein FKM82_028768 [Ascaphus truei]